MVNKCTLLAADLDHRCMRQQSFEVGVVCLFVLFVLRIFVGFQLNVNKLNENQSRYSVFYSFMQLMKRSLR